MDSKEKGVLGVLSWSIYKIVRIEVNYAVCKAKVSKNWSKYTVIQGEKICAMSNATTLVLSLFAQPVWNKYIRNTLASSVDC